MQRVRRFSSQLMFINQPFFNLLNPFEFPLFSEITSYQYYIVDLWSIYGRSIGCPPVFLQISFGLITFQFDWNCLTLACDFILAFLSVSETMRETMRRDYEERLVMASHREQNSHGKDQSHKRAYEIILDMVFVVYLQVFSWNGKHSNLKFVAGSRTGAFCLQFSFEIFVK